MAKKKQAPFVAAVPAPVITYWTEQVQGAVGRKAFFVDTAAILESLAPNDSEFGQFFDELVGERLVTSTYVVAETVSRMVKSKPRQFVGPGGEQNFALALYFVRRWLIDRNVVVLCVPDFIFEYAKEHFAGIEHVGCDLVDTLSYVIVRGLGQERIISRDTHFQQLGLMCYPRAS